MWLKSCREGNAYHEMFTDQYSKFLVQEIRTNANTRRTIIKIKTERYGI